MGPGTVPVVETARLLLRRPTPADAAPWAHALETDPTFLEFVPARADPPKERAERFVRNYVDRWQQSPLAMGWTVVTKADQAFIGFAGVDAGGEAEGELEYFVIRPFWRRGFASEMAAAVTHHWFRTTDGNELVAFVVQANVGSVRVVEKLGYRRVGIVNYLELMGNPPGVSLATPMAAEYRLDREEWTRRSGPAT
jgi:ribosomal-protein-alanine N-acetyltransferase